MPTRDEIERAIERLQIAKHCYGGFSCDTCPANNDHPCTTVESRHIAYDTAIACMQDQIKEPCWYCKSIELHNIKSVKTVTDELDRELGAYDTPYNFCPNCGRKPVKHDGLTETAPGRVTPGRKKVAMKSNVMTEREKTGKMRSDSDADKG